MASINTLKLALWLSLFVFFSTNGAVAQRVKWEKLPGGASDIGVGSRGDLWAIGTIPAPGGFVIQEWVGDLLGGTWKRRPGGARTIAVGEDPPFGPWVINDRNEIFMWRGKWIRVTGKKARDIGVTKGGVRFIISTEPVKGGYAIYHWNGADKKLSKGEYHPRRNPGGNYITGQWKRFHGGGIRIDVGPRGRPWIIDDKNRVLFHDEKKGWVWVHHALAKDIGVGSNVWIVGMNNVPYRLEKGGWNKTNGYIERISVGPRGRPVAVGRTGQILTTQLPRLLHFERTRNAAIKGHNIRQLKSVTPRECAVACLNEGAFNCLSFDYYKAEKKCDLSNKRASDVGGLKTDYPGNPYDHYSLRHAPQGYTKVTNAAISGYNTKHLTGVTPQDCADACDGETSFRCLSFDYYKFEFACDLSDQDGARVGGLKKNYPGNPYDHYFNEQRARKGRFTKTANAAISGHNRKQLSNVQPGDCMRACLAEMSFQCVSFDYYKGKKKCDLSDKRARDVGGLKTNYSGDPYDHYSR